MGGAAILILSFVTTATAVTLMKGVLAPRLRLGARVVLALAFAAVAFAAPVIVGRFLPTELVLVVDLTRVVLAGCHFVGVFSGFVFGTQLGRR
ncbi:hypothetical protein [Arsenicicoccus dermatophilus]|uniref:hypothetical protein n=1 Tax=Arsenicicoccus dermatophilus TaxID=1076331 RepID=UPI001F4CF357|nr:hypothetical protein [Arsenicicoccus dermatophilus]MCH8612268.1 hypothetical protein [Arsenicicoccus dermatophilus]